jgi:hypothetical protein
VSAEEDVFNGVVVDRPLLPSASQVNAILAKDPATVDLPILIAQAKAANNMSREPWIEQGCHDYAGLGFLANMTRIAHMLGTDPHLSVVRHELLQALQNVTIHHAQDLIQREAVMLWLIDQLNDAAAATDGMVQHVAAAVLADVGCSNPEHCRQIIQTQQMLRVTIRSMTNDGSKMSHQHEQRAADESTHQGSRGARKVLFPFFPPSAPHRPSSNRTTTSRC